MRTGKMFKLSNMRETRISLDVVHYKASTSEQALKVEGGGIEMKEFPAIEVLFVGHQNSTFFAYVDVDTRDRDLRQLDRATGILTGCESFTPEQGSNT